MFGRAPMMMAAPSFGQPMAMEMMPQQQFANPPTRFFQPPSNQWQGTPGQNRMPTPPQSPVVSQPVKPPAYPVVSQPTPAPKFRAQNDDEAPPPRRVTIPTPEELGVVAAQPAQPESVDWLDRLGATCVHLEKTADGGCLVTCFLPTSQPNRTRRIEGQGRTHAEAVRQVLQRADEWRRQINGAG